MSAPDVDVLILGGGCAGLSLAAALADRAPHLTVHTLERRAAYGRDRTWCFWETAQHSFAEGITHRWHSWRVRHGGGEVRQQSGHYSYQHLPADRFYELAMQRAQRAQQTVTMGVDVRSVSSADGLCRVETGLGKLTARWVFDSRPLAEEDTAPVLLQRFLGWHVRCDRPSFDPAVVDLMDFQPGTQRGRTTFLYLLPFSATEALLELTFLEEPGLPPADAEELLQAQVQQRCGAEYEVLYREAASLPMGERLARRPSPGNVLPIGTRGGRVKPSSGYAFQRIQRQSAALATALARGETLPRRYEPRFYAWLDAIFLRAMQRAPERVPGYFLQLFRKTPADALVRFLSETASPAGVLRTMLTLPTADFLRAALPLRTEEQPAC